MVIGQGALEALVVTHLGWAGRRVFVTGHTGFKGSWLCAMLDRAGAHVHGFALDAPTTPSLFEVARIRETLSAHVVADIRDAESLQRAMAAARPEVVFHLAAQSLVRRGYREPTETYSVNVLGTVNVLEAARSCADLRAVVSVTTDKCYENREWAWGYREIEALGGADPYSSSKACAELVTAAYRRSFLAERGVAVATARAGNVIGGGDWATDRLIPDFFRATEAGHSLEVRYPAATRPWQHVLEPLTGYLKLAAALLNGQEGAADAWNFGPADTDVQPVSAVLDHLCGRMPGSTWHATEGQHPHEAALLRLDSSKARTGLGWAPAWALPAALDRTLAWHQAWREGSDMQQVCMAQIEAHSPDEAGSHGAL